MSAREVFGLPADAGVWSRGGFVACEPGVVVMRVEVFPVEPYSWIAVIEVPGGPFSTETTSASDVEREVAASIDAVLGPGQPAFVLVDELGEPWSPSVAPAQMRRLEIVFDERTWLPTRQPLRERILRRRPAWVADCPACGHDWREHVPSDGECGECRYELEHEEPEAPTTACPLMPSAEARLGSRRSRRRRPR